VVESFRFHDKIVFRTPTFSLNKLIASETEIDAINKSPEFQEALFNASPELYNELIKSLAKNTSIKKKSKQLEYSVRKYVSRICSRCTPFGLFAACSTGTWGDRSEIIVEPKCKRRTRLDMNVVCTISRYLCNQPSIKNSLRYFPNTSLFTLDNEYRFIAYAYNGDRRNYCLKTVDRSEYVQSVLNCIKEGAMISEIMHHIAPEEHIEEIDKRAFVDELIDSQMIISELEPSVTGEEYYLKMLTTLKSINSIRKCSEISRIIEILSSIERDLDNLDNLDNECNSNLLSYKAIQTKLADFGVSVGPKNLFQIDGFRTTSKAVLNRGIQEKIMTTFNFLKVLCASRNNSDLDNFVRKFNELFEYQEIPFLHAIDPDIGIGYPSDDFSGTNPFIADLEGSQTGAVEGYHRQITQTEDLLFKKLISATQDGAYVVKVDKELLNIKTNRHCLSDTLSVMFRVIDRQTEKIQIKYFGGGSGAANLLGRFAHGDKNIRKIINDIAQFEQLRNKDAILAEIAHLPEDRIGNIVLRPIFRDYEIPIQVRSGVNKEKQIPLDDLWISVKNGRLFLRSKRLNREIIPRLSTAHGFRFTGTPAYKLLGDLQMQNKSNAVIKFDWGQFSSMFTFLPRVEYMDVVIFPATWNLSIQDCQSILIEREDDCLMTRVCEWQQGLKIPRWVYLEDADNELMVDFKSQSSIEMFVDTIRKRNTFRLCEFLFQLENSLITDTHGASFANEVIATMFNQSSLDNSQTNRFQNVEKRNVMQFPPEMSVAKRYFIPGSNWHYYKIYCGVKMMNKVLLDTLKPLLDILRSNDLITEYFFVRYYDGHHHIRIRFFSNNSINNPRISTIVGEYFENLFDKGWALRIAMDTYVREIERYGEGTIELSEKFFTIDSQSVLNFLLVLKQIKNEDFQWQFAIRSAHDIIASVYSDVKSQYLFAEEQFQKYLLEHGSSKKMKLQLNKKFRINRQTVDNLMNDCFVKDLSLTRMSKILERRKVQMIPIVDRIKLLLSHDESKVSIDQIAASFIHMAMNRIFENKQRTCEMVIYRFLSGYYKSLIGRSQ